MLQAWEGDFGKPERIASALDIMIARLGSSRLQQRIRAPEHLRVFSDLRTAGAGIRPHGDSRLPQAHHDRRGLGNVRRPDVEKKEVVVGAPLIVLGGRRC